MTPFSVTASAEDEGRRLDVVLAERLPGRSRTLLKKSVRLGRVLVDGAPQKPSFKVEAGQVITGTVEDAIGDGPVEPQEMALEILHEDASLLVVNKPAGIAVHPGSGRRDGTLANALAFHIEDLSDVGGAQRPGIVHRLDRDTSGVMVVAKTNRAHHALSAQFQARETKKEYRAILEGELELDGDVISKPVGRSRADPSRMAVDAIDGRPAETAWSVIERFESFTHVRCVPKTGRTHQIRVHMRSMNRPLLCDAVYGRRSELRLSDLAPAARGAPDDRVILARQALHAFAIEFRHPLEARPMRFEAPPPSDFEAALAELRRARPAGRRQER